MLEYQRISGMLMRTFLASIVSVGAIVGTVLYCPEWYASRLILALITLAVIVWCGLFALLLKSNWRLALVALLGAPFVVKFGGPAVLFFVGWQDW